MTTATPPARLTLWAQRRAMGPPVQSNAARLTSVAPPAVRAGTPRASRAPSAPVGAPARTPTAEEAARACARAVDAARALPDVPDHVPCAHAAAAAAVRASARVHDPVTVSAHTPTTTATPQAYSRDQVPPKKRSKRPRHVPHEAPTDDLFDLPAKCPRVSVPYRTLVHAPSATIAPVVATGPLPSASVRAGLECEVFRVGDQRSVVDPLRTDRCLDDLTGTGIFVPVFVESVCAHTGGITVVAPDVWRYTGRRDQSIERNVPYVYARREPPRDADPDARLHGHGARVETRWYIHIDDEHRGDYDGAHTDPLDPEHRCARWLPSLVVGRGCYACGAQSAPGTMDVCHDAACTDDRFYGYVVKADCTERAWVAPFDVRAPTDIRYEPPHRLPTRHLTL